MCGVIEAKVHIFFGTRLSPHTIVAPKMNLTWTLNTLNKFKAQARDLLVIAWGYTANPGKWKPRCLLWNTAAQ